MLKWYKWQGLYCFNAENFAMISIIVEKRNYIGGAFMSRISEDQVKHAANLARLAITEEEAEMLTNQLDKIITFAEQLNELNTDNVEPTAHVLEIKNVMREDRAQQGLPREEVLKNAPEHQDGQIKVPGIME
jgi:aspartyl-tRNA(Asn)/glutamyl-tRNA(Gln) amidotransferase subunit C